MTFLVRPATAGLTFATLLGAGALAPRARAQQVAQASDVQRVAPGVTYRHISDPAAHVEMHLVTVDLRRKDIALREVRALDSLRGRERPSSMAKRLTASGDTVLAAVNGDFFWLTTGENENNQVLGGEWWKGVRVTDSPYDTWDNTHSQLAVDDRGAPSFDRYEFDGVAIARGTATPIIALNFALPRAPEGTALFTWRYGANTPRDTTRATVEVAMTAAGHRGDTLLLVRSGALAATSGSPIPRDGAVLAAYGNGLRSTEVRAMAEGDTVKLVLATRPKLAHGAVPRLLIGGWPRLLRDGHDVATEAARLEGTLSRNAEVKHPRTGVGVSRDRKTLYLVAVDGRSQESGGVTLPELSRILAKLGAWDAMNFDGGGSTTMVVRGEVVNRPSESEGERAVGNALVIVRRR